MWHAAHSQPSTHSAHLSVTPTANQSLAKHNRKPSQMIEDKQQRPKSIASFCRVFRDCQGKGAQLKLAATKSKPWRALDSRWRGLARGLTISRLLLGEAPQHEPFR